MGRWPVRDERGSVVPAFLVLVLLTLVMGTFFFQTGRAADLGAEAQTGSDAAALAAAEDIGEQIIRWIQTGAWNERPFIVDAPAAAAAAQRYAATNDVLVTGFSIRTVGYLAYEVDVEARTTRSLDPAGYVSEDPETGERSTFTVGDGQRGVQAATAKVAPGAGSFLGTGYFQGSGAAGGGGAPPSSSGGCRIPDAQVEALAVSAGVTGVIGDGGRRSALMNYSDCDGGQSVHALTDEMKISILKVEAALGRAITLNSAYRSPAYQAQLCRRVTGPCAAPGRSMHNIGLAIDTSDHAVIAPIINADPSIGLCQPLPANDAVHFSHASGRECGGRTGTAGLGSFQAWGGLANLRSMAMLEVVLTR